MSEAYEGEFVTLVDEEEGEMTFRVAGRLELDGVQYAALEDPEDEGSVMIYKVIPGEDGDAYDPLTDEEACERIFYLIQADIDDYEFGPAE